MSGKKICLLLSMCLALLSAGPPPMFAQGKGNKGGGGGCRGATPLSDPIPLTATFRDTLNGFDTRIQGDGAPYPDGSALITCAGEIEIKNQEDFGRQIFLNFSDPSSPAPCEPDCLRELDTYLTAPFIWRTNVMANTGDPTEDDGSLVGGAWAIPDGQSRQSRLKVNFSTPNGTLTIRFKPDAFADTSWLLVTRTSSTTWTVEAASNDIAKLMTPDFQASTTVKGKNKTKGHDEGNFFMPFILDVEIR